MAEISALTLEMLYGLFAPSAVPEELSAFPDLITEESAAPIGQEKPEGLADLPPFTKHQKDDKKRNGTRNQRGKKAPKLVIGRPKPIVSQVEVNPKFANVDFAAAWGKPKPKAEPEAPKEAAPAPAPAPVPAQPQQSAWGKPVAKPKKPSFAALMEEEGKENNTKVSYTQESVTTEEILGRRNKMDAEYPSLGGKKAFKPAAARDQAPAKGALDDGEWPSLGGKAVVKKKSAWGSIKP